jgi:serine/threonine protein kinase
MQRKPTFNEEEVIDKKYKVVQTLFGGMGEIIVCSDEQKGSDELVVLKTYFDDTFPDSASRKRFIREAEAWLKLGDPMSGFYLGLNQILIIKNKPYLLMNYCPGGSLRDRLDKSQLKIEDAIIYATQMLHALSQIEYHGLIHRDLKPDNILFDNQGEIKVSDLGIAKIPDEQDLSGDQISSNSKITQTGAFVGTILYAAPEQFIRIPDLDGRVDIWAFGVVVYEMIVGRHPFLGSRKPIIETILSQDPPDWNVIGKRTNIKMQAVIAKCMEKDRKNRYATFKELIIDWDKAIKFRNSPVKEGRAKDDRILINDHSTIIAWFSLFPERDSGGIWMTSNYGSNKGSLAEAEGLCTLGKYEKALGICEQILREPNDPKSMISLLLQGKLLNKVTFRKGFSPADPSKTLKAYAEQALYLKMTVLVELIEQRSDKKDYVQQLVTLSNLILESAIKEKEILVMCAEGYILATQYQKAAKLLESLLGVFPDDVKIPVILLITLDNAGDSQGLEKLSRLLYQRHGERDDLDSQMICARAAFATQNWELAVHYAKCALTYQPTGHHMLLFICMALLWLKRTDEAYPYFQELEANHPNLRSLGEIRKNFHKS